MPLEEFILTVFCWVEVQVAQILQRVKLRQRGYAPRLSDTEVITMEIVGAVLGYAGDEAIWEYCRRHGLPWFPGLGGRPTGRRQAATVGWVKQGWHQRWVAELGADTADGAII